MVSQEGAEPPLEHPKSFCLSKLLNLTPFYPSLLPHIPAKSKSSAGCLPTLPPFTKERGNMISQEGAKPPLKHPKGFCLHKVFEITFFNPPNKHCAGLRKAW